MTDERIQRPYSSDLMRCSECGQTYDELFGECPRCNPLSFPPPKLNPLSPWDELAKRVERLELHVLDVNKAVLDELRLINHDIKKIRMDMHRLGEEIDELKEG